METQIEGNIIDIYQRRIYPAKIFIKGNKISRILETAQSYSTFICPGFIDAHVHIESSMLLPTYFSDLVIQKGTVAVVSDPHEIANVKGKEGVLFMLEQGKKAKIKVFTGIPSCVPASAYDCNGGSISASDIEDLAKTGEFILLSEVMNFPAVIQGEPEIRQKLEIAHQYHLKIDGHAPGLRGEDLEKYVSFGITTDHECTTLEEAEEKISKGMKILIREGSAAQNYTALSSLIQKYPEKVMFCTDDSHPDAIIEKGHIDKIIKLALKGNYDIFDVLKIASYNAIQHYGLPVGCLKVEDYADFVRIKDLESFEVMETYINGEKVYDKKRNLSFKKSETDMLPASINSFSHDFIEAKELKKQFPEKISYIQVIKGEITTGKGFYQIQDKENYALELRNKDILKLIYVNRYSNMPPVISYIRGFGLKEGAFASSIAHDSHNILAVGVTEEDLTEVINSVIEQKGGIAVKNTRGIFLLPLPIGGIMSDKSGEEVYQIYKKLHEEIKYMGTDLPDPFMTLSFMSLLVVPEWKIGEKGIFDFNKFEFME